MRQNLRHPYVATVVAIAREEKTPRGGLGKPLPAFWAPWHPEENAHLATEEETMKEDPAETALPEVSEILNADIGKSAGLTDILQLMHHGVAEMRRPAAENRKCKKIPDTRSGWRWNIEG